MTTTTYYHQHKAERLAYQKKYATANKKKIKEYKKQWHLKKLALKNIFQ